jgi:peptide/nickel transport system substrate-binding protein
METPVSHRRLASLVLGAVLAAGAASACSSASPSSSTQAAASKTLVVINTTAAPSLDSQEFSTGSQEEVLVNVGEPLLRYAPTNKTDSQGALLDQSAQFVGGACVKFALTSTEFECTLGHYVSPYGNVLTSADVKWTLDYLVAAASNGVVEMSLAGINTSNPITVLSSTQFDINLASPDTTTEAALTFYTFDPYDATEVMKHATKADPWGRKWIADHTAMFGPYTVSRFVPNQEVDLVANPNYRGNPAAGVPAPSYTKIVYRNVPNIGTQAELLKTGSAQLAKTLNEDLYEPLKNSTTTKTYTVPYNAATSLYFNVNQAPFNNLNMRKAIQCSIDKQQVSTDVYFGEWPVASSFVDSDTPGYTTAYDPCPSANTTLAKQYLKASGYAGQTLSLYYTDGITGDDAGETATLLQTQLAKVGIKTSLQSVPDSATYFGGMGKGSYGMFVYFYGSNVPTPEWTFGIWFGPGSGLNWTNYTSPQTVADLAVLKDSPVTSAAQKAAALDFQKQLFQNAVAVPIAAGEYNYTLYKSVCGFRADPGTFLFWQYLHPCS